MASRLEAHSDDFQPDEPEVALWGTHSEASLEDSVTLMVALEDAPIQTLSGIEVAPIPLPSITESSPMPGHLAAD